MKLKKMKFVLFIFALLGIVGWSQFSYLAPSNSSVVSQAWVDKEMKLIKSQASNLDPTVLKLSLQAYQKARKKGLINKEVMTIIDYRKSSVDRRLWVVDLRSGKVLYNTWVSHGRNSGNVSATSFSNQPGSLKSSVGVFLTESPYFGKNGYSLRLIGLEPGINSNAYRRAIVVHGARYVNPDIIRNGRLGRSWGCPAVGLQLARPLINTIKERTLFFVYSNDRTWLNKSTFLAG